MNLCSIYPRSPIRAHIAPTPAPHLLTSVTSCPSKQHRAGDPGSTAVHVSLLRSGDS